MRFEVLDHADTPLGTLLLWRRHEPTHDATVYEVKLGDEFLMSSLYTVAERELATRGLAAAGASRLDVVVGGLGLGCTARAALDDPRVASLTVVEAFDEVISWHRRRLLPDSDALVDDERVRLQRGDFFGLAADGALARPQPDGRCDVVLLDIDHAPDHLLADAHGCFYTATGLQAAAAQLRDGGVLAVWSDDPPDAGFQQRLAGAFAEVWADEIAFPNPHTGQEATNTVYLARRSAA